MELIEPWSGFKIRLRIKREGVDSRKRIRDIIGEFDFSLSFHPLLMQFIMTKDLNKIEKYLQDKGYSIKIKGSDSEIDVWTNSEKNNIDIEEEGNVLCDTISQFTIGYEVRAIVLPNDKYRSSVNIKSTAQLLVYWDEENLCFWLSGLNTVVEEAYGLAQKDHPKLWKLPKDVIFSVDNEYEIKKDHFKWNSCQITLTSSLQDKIAKSISIRIEISPFVQTSLAQFALFRDNAVDSLDQCLHRLHSDSWDTEPILGLQGLNRLTVASLNSLLQYLTEFDFKSIQIPQDIVADVKKMSFEGLALFWEKDYSMVWVTGRRDSVAIAFSTIAASIDDRKIRLERAQVHKIPNMYIEMTEHEFATFSYFGNQKSWIKRIVNDLSYKNGKLEIFMDDENGKEEIQSFAENIKTMSQETFTLRSDEIQNLKGPIQEVQQQYKNVFLFLKDNKLKIISSNEYEMQAVKTVLREKLGFGASRRERFRKLESDIPWKSKDEKSVSKETVLGTQFQTQEGIIVKIYEESILRVKVDCIVSASNDRLMHGGGVAAAISDAAGYEFDRESADYIAKNGAIPVGKCCVTSAGKLSYKCVIHAVGPRWGDYTYDDKQVCLDDLQEAVEVTFREADKRGMKSIALPALSSGIFGVPREKCAEQYHRAVMTFSFSYPHTNLKEIHFVDRDSFMITMIKSVFSKQIKT